MTIISHQLPYLREFEKQTAKNCHQILTHSKLALTRKNQLILTPIIPLPIFSLWMSPDNRSKTCLHQYPLPEIKEECFVPQIHTSSKPNLR